uniref:Uncharacterized protein n=1 Tax=Arundo donax TaxID=35708 RepID=A0A0A8Y649_ARUDO
MTQYRQTRPPSISTSRKKRLVRECETTTACTNPMTNDIR